jgi:hypothetical protein
MDFLDPDLQHNLPYMKPAVGVCTFYSPCQELRCLWLRIRAFFLNRIHMNPDTIRIWIQIETNMEDCTPKVFYVFRSPSSCPCRGFELTSSRDGVRRSEQWLPVPSQVSCLSLGKILYINNICSCE